MSQSEIAFTFSFQHGVDNHKRMPRDTPSERGSLPVVLTGNILRGRKSCMFA